MEERALKIQAIAVPVISLMVLTLFFYYAKPILVPVVLGVTFAFILNPAVKLLKKMKIPHTLAVIVVILVALIIFLSIAAVIGAQAGDMVTQLPTYWKAFQAQTLKWMDKFPSIAQYLPGELSQEASNPLKDVKWDDIASMSRYFFAGLGSAMTFLGKVILIMLIATFVLIEQVSFKKRLANLFGEEHASASREMVDQISNNISGYLAVRFTTTCGLGIVVTIGLLIMGVPYAYVWGPLAGVLNLIPYVGAVIGAIPPMIVGSIHHGSMWWLLYIGLLFVVIQFFEGNIITPKLVGNRINLNLTSVLISTLFWGWIWGGVGVILAMPITATFKVICDHVEALRPIGSLIDGRFKA